MLKSALGSKLGRRTSYVWNYFTLINNKFATCNLCGVRITHSTSNSNLKRHLKGKHRDHYIQKKNPTTFKDQEHEIEEGLAEDDGHEDYKEVGGIVISKPVPEKKLTFKHSKIINTPKIPLLITRNNKSKSNNNNEIEEAITILSNIAQSRVLHTTHEDDEFGQFGKYVASQLRQLPLVTALDIQEQFYCTLNRERIKAIKKLNEEQITVQVQHYTPQQSLEQQCTPNQHNTEHQYSQQQKELYIKSTVVQLPEVVIELSPTESAIDNLTDCNKAS